MLSHTGHSWLTAGHNTGSLALRPAAWTMVKRWALLGWTVLGTQDACQSHLMWMKNWVENTTYGEERGLSLWWERVLWWRKEHLIFYWPRPAGTWSETRHSFYVSYKPSQPCSVPFNPHNLGNRLLCFFPRGKPRFQSQVPPLRHSLHPRQGKALGLPPRQWREAGVGMIPILQMRSLRLRKRRRRPEASQVIYEKPSQDTNQHPSDSEAPHAEAQQILS